MARTKTVTPPEAGGQAPEFVLPSAQGGQLRLSLRTVRGPVIVAFYRGVWSEECVEYFAALAGKEREINVAGATLVGIGAVEPDEAREFARRTGFKSYILYDYVRLATRDYGVLEKDAAHGDAARPAVFLVDSDGAVRHAWLDERPAPDELLAKVTEITGLPREPDEDEEAEEKPKKRPAKAAKPAGNEAGAEESGAGEAAKSDPAKGESPSNEAPTGDAPTGDAPTGEAPASESSSEATEKPDADKPRSAAGDEVNGAEAPGGEDAGDEEISDSDAQETETAAGAEPSGGGGGAEGETPRDETSRDEGR